MSPYIRYKYDSRANITSKIDNINGTREYYAYDDMDRIKSWNYRRTAHKKKKRTAKTLNRTYRYDIDGNMVYKSGIGSMVYNGRNQLISTQSGGAYAYDANGNMTKGNGKSYSYNAFNKVKGLPRSHVARGNAEKHNNYQKCSISKRPSIP